MTQSYGRERPFPSIHNILKMLLSNNSPSKPCHDLAEDPEEHPDQHGDDGIVYIKSPTVLRDHNESLLTRALKTNSPELSPAEHPCSPSPFDHIFSFRSGPSAGELASDGGLPSLSNSPSPPLPPHFARRRSSVAQKEVGSLDPSESTVEANLGRKRCISFACASQSSQPQPVEKNTNVETTTPTETPKRKTTITFACPAREPETCRERSPLRRPALRSRPYGSPAPLARRASMEQNGSSSTQTSEEKQKTTPLNERRGIPTSGLGKFEESEETRFHEFASSVDEDPEWVTKTPDYTQKITMDDCLRKENVIRKLGEEAEEEAREDEEDEDDADADDVNDDDLTVHDFSDDDGNESDNEAGFAESDESDNESDCEFWIPSAAATSTIAWKPDVFGPTRGRRDSYTSIESMTDPRQHWLPAPPRKGNGHRPKPPKMRPGTPNLPDSTDFVCGTLDEDRPLEAAYKSCMEQRRLSKQIPIPQDIDPSFPTSDPDEDGDSDGLSDDEAEETVLHKQLAAFDDDALRGRPGHQTHKGSPRPSPKRMISPPPRRHGRSSPKRLKSPPPRTRAKSPSPVNRDQNVMDGVPPLPTRGLNINELVQRPVGVVRTKSLPRTPNPFFTRLEKSHRWMGIPPLEECPSREQSRTREVHTRGPVDIVEGLERKRQKRKEKFWRQHCRKAAKEQMERRPIPGKGAERMKELGLEVAERCRAYGVSQDAQLVLSV